MSSVEQEARQKLQAGQPQVAESLLRKQLALTPRNSALRALLSMICIMTSRKLPRIWADTGSNVWMSAMGPLRISLPVTGSWYVDRGGSVMNAENSPCPQVSVPNT